MSFSKVLIFIMIMPAIALISACDESAEHLLFTIADARAHPAKWTDTGEQGDSTGDILTFDQPLLNKSRKQIGNNSGFCVRTRVAHSFQCQWTLSLEGGSIQVAGREFDKGESSLGIVGGTGAYLGMSGEMRSINNNDGTFTQVLHYRLKR